MSAGIRNSTPIRLRATGGFVDPWKNLAVLHPSYLLPFINLKIYASTSATAL